MLIHLLILNKTNMFNLYFIKTALCSIFFLALVSTGLSAQNTGKVAPKPQMLDKGTLPKLDQAVMGGGEYGSGKVVDFSKKRVEDDMVLSETEVKGRSEADGKMSKAEQDLLARARRQPQVD
jgi:hypothetical protein